MPAGTADRRPSGFFFITPVWGEAYIRLFLDTVIPAQLSPGNLPAFRGETGHAYLIYTKPADAETIRSAPVFARLRDVIDVKIEIIDEQIDAVHDTMSNCFRRGVALADAADAAIVFLTPDMVFADGSFAALKRLSQAGHDVIFVPGLRTLKQGVSLALHERRRSGDAICVPPRDLMRIALDNLHPLGDSSWWDQGESDLLPSNIYWRVGNDGILGHCFHLHPILVHPQHKNAVFFGTVDDDFFLAACPDNSRDHVVVDSDEFLGIELSDPRRFFRTGCRKGSAKDAAWWAEQAANARHRTLFPYPVRMHTGIRDPAAWSDAERRAVSATEAIEACLRRPTSSLLLSADPALPRRLVRRILDRQLIKANRRELPQTAAAPPGAITNAVLDLGAALLAFYRRGARDVRALDQVVRSAVFGSERSPPVWTFRYWYRRALLRDLTAVLRSAGATVAVCRDPATSPVAGALAATDRKATNCFFSAEESDIRLVDYDHSAAVAERSQDTVVIDRALPDIHKVSAVLKEAGRVLRPGGRLVLVTASIHDPAVFSENEISLGAGTAAALVAPEFTVVERRTQGGFGSVLAMFIASWFSLQRARLPLPRPLAFALFLLALPLYVALALPANVVIALLNAIDVSNRFAASSVIVAVRNDQPPN